MLTILNMGLGYINMVLIKIHPPWKIAQIISIITTKDGGEN